LPARNVGPLILTGGLYLHVLRIGPGGWKKKAKKLVDTYNIYIFKVLKKVKRPRRIKAYLLGVESGVRGRPPSGPRQLRSPRQLHSRKSRHVRFGKKFPENKAKKERQREKGLPVAGSCASLPGTS
jgi:hypothetical protein